MSYKTETIEKINGFIFKRLIFNPVINNDEGETMAQHVFDVEDISEVEIIEEYIEGPQTELGDLIDSEPSLENVGIEEVVAYEKRADRNAGEQSQKKS